MENGKATTAIAQAILDRGYNLPVIYDIGASSCAWTGMMCKVFPLSQFVLFEPRAHMNASFKSQFQNLKTIYPKISMNAVAIGEKDDEIEIDMLEDVDGHPIVQNDLLVQSNVATVPVRSIDSIVTKREYPQPDFLRLDVGGGEIAAIKGAATSLPGVQFLFLETWLQRGNDMTRPLFHEMVPFLAQQNFVPYEFTDVYRSHNGETASIDVVFINKNKFRHNSNPLYNLLLKLFRKTPF
jgi:FkbM family methyltransferase